MLEKVIYNEIRFKNKNLIYNIKLLKIIQINNIGDIKRALKLKSFLLIINFNNDSKIGYFEIKMKSAQNFKIKSLLLLLFKKCSRVYKISKI